MIEFTRLVTEGFCSISQADIALNQNQIVWIRGANGEGKSSLISSLVWCIYGKNLKGKSQVNTWVLHCLQINLQNTLTSSALEQMT